MTASKNQTLDYENYNDNKAPKDKREDMPRAFSFLISAIQARD